MEVLGVPKGEMKGEMEVSIMELYYSVENAFANIKRELFAEMLRIERRGVLLLILVLPICGADADLALEEL